MLATQFNPETYASSLSEPIGVPDNKTFRQPTCCVDYHLCLDGSRYCLNPFDSFNTKVILTHNDTSDWAVGYYLQ